MCVERAGPECVCARARRCVEGAHPEEGGKEGGFLRLVRATEEERENPGHQ